MIASFHNLFIIITIIFSNIPQDILLYTFPSLLSSVLYNSFYIRPKIDFLNKKNKKLIDVKVNYYFYILVSFSIMSSITCILIPMLYYKFHQNNLSIIFNVFFQVFEVGWLVIQIESFIDTYKYDDYEPILLNNTDIYNSI